MNFSSSELTVTGADEGVGFGAGAGCDGAEETVLSAGGLEETDDTGSAELTAELVLSTADDTLGCDEMVLLSVCALFGVFFAARYQQCRANNQSRRFNFTSHIFCPI